MVNIDYEYVSNKYYGVGSQTLIESLVSGEERNRPYATPKVFMLLKELHYVETGVNTQLTNSANDVIKQLQEKGFFLGSPTSFRAGTASSTGIVAPSGSKVVDQSTGEITKDINTTSVVIGNSYYQNLGITDVPIESVTGGDVKKAAELALAVENVPAEKTSSPNYTKALIIVAAVLVAVIGITYLMSSRGIKLHYGR
jgi:hypothetical protein